MDSESQQSQESQESAESKNLGFSILALPQLIRQKFLEAVTSFNPQDLERKVEEGVNKALGMLNIPTRDEVRELQERIEDLIVRCDSLLEKKKQ